MEALKKKFKSSGGASLLIAMMFMLVCMTVGVSVFMAADANAGKAASNRDEQKKYLALSSAVKLLVDELESVEFYGVYSYEMTGFDEEGASVTPPDPAHHYQHFYKLEEDSITGSAVLMRRRTDAPLASFDADLMADLMPLFQNMEHILRTTFKTRVIEHMHENNDSRPEDFSDPDDLTALGEGPAMVSSCRLYVDVEDVYEDEYTAIVDVTLYETRIRLAAHLEGDDYLVKAELETEGSPSAPFNFNFSDDPSFYPAVTGPVRWNLRYFTNAA